jgi:type II secretory pathway component GspD/PulD (secretin)
LKGQVLLGGALTKQRSKNGNEKKEFLSDVSTIGELFGEIFFILFTRSWCL